MRRTIIPDTSYEYIEAERCSRLWFICHCCANSLAFDQDPTTSVYDQQAMRPHLITSFEKMKIAPFPVLKHRRPADKVSKVEECILHCYCRMPDDGYEMVCCDLCDAWHHKACVNDSYCKDSSWLCTHCSKNVVSVVLK